MITGKEKFSDKKNNYMVNIFHIRYPLTSYYICNDNRNIPTLPPSADVLVLRTYRAGGKHQWC